MNPLGNGTRGINPQMFNKIKEVKSMMQMAKGNPYALLQQNPQMAQVLQMCNGQSPEMVFRNLCKQRNVDPDSIINELRS